MNRKIAAITIPVVGILGLLLRGAPSDPDSPSGYFFWLGTFLVFVFWSWGMLAWGEVISHRLKTQAFGWTATLGWASAFAVITAMIGAYAGWIGYENFWIGFLIPTLGAFFAATLPPIDIRWSELKKNFRKNYSKNFSWIVRATLWALFLGAFMLKGFSLHGTSDPPQYHLYGPRLWSDAGQEYFLGHAPIVYQVWVWEYLFLWGNLLIGAAQGGGLIEGQMFGQWCHVFWGWFQAGIALELLLSLWIFSPLLRTGVVLFSLMSGSLVPVAWLAKNDWGSVAWILSGISILWHIQADVKLRDRMGAWALAGLLLTLGSLSKANAGFFALSALSFFALQGLSWIRPRYFAVFLCGVAPGIILVLSRNYHLTGSPFFPYWGGPRAAEIFSPTYRKIAFESGPRIRHGLGFVFGKILTLVQDNWTGSLVFLAPIAVFRKWSRQIGYLSILAWVGTSWYFVLDIAEPFTRWISTPLILLPALVLTFGVGTLERVKHVSARTFLALCFVVLIGASGIRANLMGAWAGFNPEIDPYRVIRNPAVHWAGDSKAWLRLNAANGEKIVSLSDNQFYYVSNLRITGAVDDPAVSSPLDGIHDGEEVLHRLIHLGYRFALDGLHWSAPAWTAAAVDLRRVVEQHPESIVFEGDSSFIVDLERLESEVSSACPEIKMLPVP